MAGTVTKKPVMKRTLIQLRREPDMAIYNTIRVQPSQQTGRPIIR
jgi:hypothetical protein